MYTKLFIILSVLYLSTVGFSPIETTNYKNTPNGPVIEWAPDVKLSWPDFKSKKKVTSGFSIAASTCGFGFDGMIRGDEIVVNVYVRFYCNDSWKNPDYAMDDVLKHEQLHFDICEVYGRKFYKGIVELRDDNALTEKSLQRMYDALVEEYDEYQDVYDAETGHSTKTQNQEMWNKKIENQLESLDAFADYHEF